jgi:uncharacterized membrane protein YfcA
VIAAVLLLVGGVGAGIFGSLLGLGGGVLLVPLLTLGFGRPLRESVAVALVCVIVTSSAATRVYLQNKVANLRLGMYLALFTALGSLVGGAIAFLIEERVLALMFAGLLVYVAISMAQAGRHRPEPPIAATASATGGRTEARGSVFVAMLAGDGYRVRRAVPAAFASIGSGIVSALLGVGGGTINVPTMHLLMGAPLRVATSTSNLMVGVTAIASSILYFARGEVDPWIAGPTALGVFVGATIGSKNAHRVDVRVLRWLFVIVLSYTALQMALRAIPL